MGRIVFLAIIAFVSLPVVIYFTTSTVAQPMVAFCVLGGVVCEIIA